MLVRLTNGGLEANLCHTAKSCVLREQVSRKPRLVGVHAKAILLVKGLPKEG
jgi:hypothetical protein